MNARIVRGARGRGRVLATRPRSRLHGALLLALCALAPARAVAQQAPRDSAPASAIARAADELRPGDVVRLRIWREPDLSGDFMVDENGIVTLPRVGPIMTAGMPFDSLRSRLVQLYRSYVAQLSIELTPLRRVQVTGAVRNPGLYTVDPTMTIADAIALAGGVTSQGRRDRVLLIHDDVPLALRLVPGERRRTEPLRSGDEVFVPESSWLSRNPGIVVAAVSATASVVWAFRRR